MKTPTAKEDKMRRKITYSLMSLILGTSLLAASAYGEPAGPPEGEGRHMERMVKELNLTEAQKKQFKEIKKEQKDAVKAHRKNAKAAMGKLHQAMQSDASEAELRKLHEQVIKIRNEGATARFEKALAIRKILTPEQRKKFRARLGKHMKERKHMRRHKREKGRRRGRGADEASE